MKYIFGFLFISYFSVAGYTQDTKSVKADILLDNIFLNQLSIDTRFINSIEYTPKGFIILSSANRFYFLGVGGMAPIFEKWKIKTDIESFTVTADGILTVVSGNALYQANSKQSFIKLQNLPDSNMGITSKYNNVYVFDRTFKKNKKDYSIYQISKDKKTVPLVKIPTPVLSVLELPSQLIFSTKNMLFSVDIKTKKLYHILALPYDGDIISIVGDTINHAFYFSTDQMIYRIKDDNIEIISNDFGGILKYDGEGLVIFNPEKKLIIRLRNNILYQEDLPKLNLKPAATPENEKLSSSLHEPRNLILNGKISEAVPIYAQLVGKNNTNAALLSEYAYALALNGVYDGALMNLDRAKLLGAFSEKDNFFAGQVFALMGYNRPAIELLNSCSVPEWIYPKYDELYQKQKSNSSIPQEDDVNISFKRANYLAAAGMNFQSVFLYEAIIREFPENYLLHIGYSIPLEKAGLLKLAIEELETGISLMGNNPESTQAKEAFNDRLTGLKEKQEEEPPNPKWFLDK